MKADCSGGSADPRRLLLGADEEGEFLMVPAADAAKHLLVCGPTGCGKTSSIFVPNLIVRVGSSAIVTEATAGNEAPDLYSKTAGYRRVAGLQRIFYFNPDDLTSDRINPIDQVHTIDQAQNLANLIIHNTSKKYSGGDPIWETSERHLLCALILHAVGEQGNLASIRHTLREGPGGMGMILVNSQIEAARDEYRAFYKNSTEGFRNGVTSGLMQRLNLWVNPRIAALTETTDIDLEALSEQLFTFYMAVPAEKTHLKPLSALIFNYILNMALHSLFKYPLFLSLDEFTNFGYIPAIAEKISIIRHRNIGVMIGIQDYAQLEKAYGREDATILFGQPANKVFFCPGDLYMAKKISQSLGTRTAVDRKVTSSGHINEREFSRPLMDPGEIMSLPPGKAIAFTRATPPILLNLLPWQEFKDMGDIKPPDRRTLEVDERLRHTCQEAQAHADWQNRPADSPPGQQKGQPNYSQNRFKQQQQEPYKQCDDRKEARLETEPEQFLSEDERFDRDAP